MTTNCKNYDVKILVCDDSMTIRKILVKSLSDLGFTKIYEADNGAKGLDLFEQHKLSDEPIQFIISDLNMPIISGAEMLKKVRSDDNLKHIPFIMVTSETEQAQIIDVIKLGCTDYIVKPFTPSTVREKVFRHIEKVHSPKSAV